MTSTPLKECHSRSSVNAQPLTSLLHYQLKSTINWPIRSKLSLSIVCGEMHEGSRPSKSGTEGPLHFETQDDKSWRQVQSVCKCNSRRVGEKTWGLVGPSPST
ncbi:unnamed protein product [Hymenolepis diminuta]|uniref:Uncharacterized protein n=1 Tax=Hymenolepis diminuta TaxID=6216 RepID=A0A564XVA1_HYMDI|nr:unnamed protein product [Hymenolepis diminuta]